MGGSGTVGGCHICTRIIINTPFLYWGYCTYTLWWPAAALVTGVPATGEGGHCCDTHANREHTLNFNIVCRF